MQAAQAGGPAVIKLLQFAVLHQHLRPIAESDPARQPSSELQTTYCSEH